MKATDEQACIEQAPQPPIATAMGRHTQIRKHDDR